MLAAETVEICTWHRRVNVLCKYSFVAVKCWMIIRDHVTIIVLVLLAASVFGLAHYHSAYTVEFSRSARLQREVVSLRMRNDMIQAALGTSQLDAINATQAAERARGQYTECELSLAESSGRLAITRERLLLLQAQCCGDSAATLLVQTWQGTGEF